MTHSKTDAGTPLVGMTAKEFRNFLDEEAHLRLDISIDEFKRRYAAAELDEGDPDVGLLSALTAVGRNNGRVAA
jgi:hypothetical protein